ncbi:unnamed protein product [Pseudo-nitzschia multistriata]|uniref:Uncharacterized protein n=1 Tax=Pseudo-nitzschia multistriata TaxID=183589 RepID=A0A448ZQ40_9STRA|nr:unnamed protein product [Pseudo-nitzschia multistriata]
MLIVSFSRGIPKRSWIVLTAGTKGLFPHVNKSRVITPSSGQVWKLMWDSSKTPTQETPFGISLWQWYESIVKPASLTVSTIALARRSSESKKAASIPLMSTKRCFKRKRGDGGTKE